ncbi:MAG: hypothetical protein IJ733_02170 [Lachnospiraceae bacterium]|nr:hypothetical protein [Lachnospiraceae bacterium]
MGIIYQKDKRSGITYAYESISVWNKELKQSRAKRKLIGRVDPDTGEIVPTDGRCRKRSPYYKGEPENTDRPIKSMTKAQLMEEVIKLRKENDDLKNRINESEGRE